MKFKNILVTGGAGFIGSHLVDKLVSEGYKVRILDNLTRQVHQGKIPKYISKKAEFIKGDVTKKEDLEKALKDIDTVFHEAAVVGVGQSMYEIEHYIYNNTLGTARLLDFLANNKHKVKRMLVASSMSAYGEGLYKCQKCGLVRPPLRSDEQMSKREWELICPNCKRLLKPVGIPENQPFSCNSVYAVTKQSQEDMVMIFGKAYGIPATALRCFNVYGPRQSLSNPYTGVAAIFLSRLKNSHPPIVYEDGLQTRDFISVYDIADANVVCLDDERSFGKVFNLGTGKPISIKEIAEILAKLLKKNIKPEITEKFRSGDVRHCTADISLIEKILRWKPKWSFEEGMKDLIEWGEKIEAKDLFDQASKELNAKGLLKT
ncbi:MAG: NAD-dependent epimerase/dehydratase [Microgenomates group bacterium Gr01-1014_7]|nr:MAG: NAD-dependent epimerase/dehydratase [Microgenomates group bacterium Gr01-1014_7]